MPVRWAARDELCEMLSFLLRSLEIAVGLAGFTGIASVISVRPSASESRAQAERLRGMIELALLVAGAALLPIVIARAGVEEPIAWRVSAAGFLATILPISVLGIRRAVRVNREGRHLREVDGALEDVRGRHRDSRLGCLDYRHRRSCPSILGLPLGAVRTADLVRGSLPSLFLIGESMRGRLHSRIACRSPMFIIVSLSSFSGEEKAHKHEGSM